MSLFMQCRSCLYNDRLVLRGRQVCCDVHEQPVPDTDDCSDYEDVADLYATPQETTDADR